MQCGIFDIDWLCNNTRVARKISMKVFERFDTSSLLLIVAVIPEVCKVCLTTDLFWFPPVFRSDLRLNYSKQINFLFMIYFSIYQDAHNLAQCFSNISTWRGSEIF
jgi:hypothetical protein